MNHTATYPPKFPLPAMGGYRYFFNGQESDENRPFFSFIRE